MRISSAILDTNILVRLMVKSDPEHSLVRSCLLGCIQNEVETFITTQNLHEAWAVLTRPRESNGYGFSVEQTAEAIQRLRALFPVLYESEDSLETWSRICRQHGVIGRQAHDARLVAIALSENVQHILTLNPVDFERYRPLITPVHPQDILP